MTHPTCEQLLAALKLAKSALESGRICAELLCKNGGAAATEIYEHELPQIKRAINEITKLMEE